MSKAKKAPSGYTLSVAGEPGREITLSLSGRLALDDLSRTDVPIVYVVDSYGAMHAEDVTFLVRKYKGALPTRRSASPPTTTGSWPSVTPSRPSSTAAWLDRTATEPAVLLAGLPEVLGTQLVARPVDTPVNDVRNDDPACLAPAREVDLPLFPG